MTYDAWKLASPPEYEQPDCCVTCDEQLEDGNCSCGDAQTRADDEYDRYCDAMEDKAEMAKEREWDR